MSEMTNEHIPALTLGWRLKMALGNMNTQAMADALEVSRATISRWMSDRGAPPRSVFVKQWALITQTDPTWLLTGQPPSSSGPESTRWYDLGAPRTTLHLVDLVRVDLEADDEAA